MKPRTTRRLTYFGVAILAMGMLLWARLILVTGRPRTAIADPEAQKQAAEAARRVGGTPENSAEKPPSPGADPAAR